MPVKALIACHNFAYEALALRKEKRCIQAFEDTGIRNLPQIPRMRKVTNI